MGVQIHANYMLNIGQKKFAINPELALGRAIVFFYMFYRRTVFVRIVRTVMQSHANYMLNIRPICFAKNDKRMAQRTLRVSRSQGLF
jgi:hypothetical protein